MRVLLIGGSGEFGLPTCKTLAGLDEIEEVVIGARNLERGHTAARQSGTKVGAIQLDATDENVLARVLGDFDFVLNMSGHDTTLPAMRATIAAGVNYCDIMSRSPSLDQLNAEAQKAGVTVISGIGIAPGLIPSLYVHLGSKLDEVRELQCYTTTPWILSLRLQEQLETGDDTQGICRELLTERDLYGGAARLVDGRKVDAIEFALTLPWQSPGTSRALGFVEGHWRDVDPVEDRASVMALGEGSPRPIKVTPDASFFPKHDWAPEATRANIQGTGFPVQLNERVVFQAERIAAKDISIADAAMEVRDELSDDPAKWLLPKTTHTSSGAGFFHVVGSKDGRPAVSSAASPGLYTEANWYLLTGAPLIAAARRVWRGEIDEKGVLLPEAILEFDGFEAEVADLLPDVPPHGRLFKQKLDYLD